MFGYVRIAKGELKVKEYEMYKAVYCSLCKNLGKQYGILSRLTLSYDFTFLSLLNMALLDGVDCFKKGRCAFNPIKKCNYCENTDALRMPSAAAMIMIYHKICDNISDESAFKKIGNIMIKPLFYRAFKKAQKEYPQISDIMDLYIKEQKAVEDSQSREIDEACDPTAKAMSEIFALCSADDTQKRVLRRLGYCMGRYIYLLDAAVDLEEDIKNGAYNVLKYKKCSDFRDLAENIVKPQLYFCANEAARAYELLDIKKYRTILGNIIYLGLEETFTKELENEKSV